MKSISPQKWWTHKHTHTHAHTQKNGSLVANQISVVKCIEKCGINLNSAIGPNHNNKSNNAKKYGSDLPKI